MEIHSILKSHFQAHYKKLIVLGTATLTIYLIKKYMDKKKKSKSKKERKKIKEFPTIEEIQKFIEELPIDAENAEKSITLKDLLGELSEFSEDEEWKELIASVHTMYQDGPDKAQEDETGSIMSIYEDPNVITLHGRATENEYIDSTSEAVKETNDDNDAHLHSRGEGDTKKMDIETTDSAPKKNSNEFELLIKNSGDRNDKDVDAGDNSSII